MKKLLQSRIVLLLSTYCIWVALFILQKPLFMLVNIGQTSGVTWQDWFRVIAAGFPMDCSVAAYFIAIPGLIFLLSVFFTKYLNKILSAYFLIASVVNTIIFIPDTILYSFWGFRIDSTVFNYLSSPGAILANISIFAAILIFIVIVLVVFLQYFILKKCIIDHFPKESSRYKIVESIIIILLLGLSFIPLRGGINTSTMNIGRVYFSKNMFLNHTAVNPIFNLLYSVNLKTDFTSIYHFMDDEKASDIFNGMMEYDRSATIPELLNNSRPNIIFIVLESFGAQIIEPLGGLPDVAPNMNKLANEGVLFSNLYACSFRTDRGIVSALAGYPAQPTMSLLKYPNKIRSLPSIPKSLVEEGYHGSFLYGGDVNYAQIKSFFVTQKVTDITGDSDFPAELRKTKWGVPDAFTFVRLSEDVDKEQDEPYVKFFLTLSSHEPFDIPTRKFDNPYLNSVAYTDSCIGVFMDKLKASPQWENTLVVFLPDHNMRYPQNMKYYEMARHHSFMIWSGGAVKESVNIEKVCSQADVAVTLLNQLHINTTDFIFSKDVINPTSKEFAFYSFPNGFGLASDKGKVIYNDDVKKVILEQGLATDTLLLQGKAFLQYLYMDIEKR